MRGLRRLGLRSRRICFVEFLVQVLDVSNHDVEQRGMFFDRHPELLDPLGNGPVGRQHFAQFDEGTDNENVQLHGALAVEHRRQHSHAVLGEGVRAGSSGAAPT